MYGFLFTVQFIGKVITAFGLGEFPYIAKSVFRRTTTISFCAWLVMLYYDDGNFCLAFCAHFALMEIAKIMLYCTLYLLFIRKSWNMILCPYLFSSIFISFYCTSVVLCLMQSHHFSYQLFFYYLYLFIFY